MNLNHILILGVLMLTTCLVCAYQRIPGEPVHGGRMVRIAELEIDPAQLENYKAALKEEIETSIRLEKGVLTLYAVSLKDNPTSIRIFETYADVDAYKGHLETPHFRKYKTTTQEMVKSLKLVEVDPILFGTR